MSKNPKRKCPEHNRKLLPKKTRYGVRYSCPVEDCTVVCWDGGTSTAANFETRQARMRAHAAFDPIFKSNGLTKGKAYKMLSEFMGLSQKETHIGHFNIEQCEKVIDFCKQYKEGETVNVDSNS